MTLTTPQLQRKGSNNSIWIPIVPDFDFDGPFKETALILITKYLQSLFRKKTKKNFSMNRTEIVF